MLVLCLALAPVGALVVVLVVMPVVVLVPLRTPCSWLKEETGRRNCLHRSAQPPLTIEDVPEVASAGCTVSLGAAEEIVSPALVRDRAVCRRPPEGRPAAPRGKFSRGMEERCAAAGALE